MQERQRSWSAVWDWTSCRVQASFHAPSSLWSGQQQHLQLLQALGAQEMQWAQALDKRPWLQMYTVPGNRIPLRWQTTEGSPGRTWQAWGGSFLLLPRRHALSSRWLWTFNHNMCENCLEEVQGSATSSLFMPPLSQNTWPCVQLLCAERNAPCQRDLAIDKAKPPASAVKWQGQVSLAWSIALRTQELYTRPRVLKERWHEERTGSRSLNFFQAVFTHVVVESSQPSAAESMSPR